MSGKEELPKSITFKIDVEAIAKKSNLEIVGELSVSTKSLKENIDNGVEKLKSTEQTKIILKNIESELGRSDSYPINQELKKTAQKNGKLTIDDFKKTFKDYNEKQIIFILMVLVQNDFGGTPYILLSQLLALTSVQFDLDPVRFGHERDISFEQNADKVTFTIMNALFGLNENNAIGKATASYTVDVKNFSITCHPGYIELYPLIITEYCKTDWREVNKKFIEIGRTLISNENKIGDNNKFKLN